MIKLYITFVFICITICSVTRVSAKECSDAKGTDCKTCLDISGCGFCKNNKECFKYTITDTNLPCKISELQAHTCVGTIQIWIIVGCVLGFVLVVAIIVIVCCICRRCKARTVSKQNKEDFINQQRLEERRNAAEIRSSEREVKRDAIRMKYGLLKEKFGENTYERMS